MKSRLKTKKGRCDGQVLEALDKGMPREELKGTLRRYVDKKYLGNNGSSQIMLWRNFLWIFAKDDPLLITCYPLPGHLGSDAKVQMERWRELDVRAAS